MVLCLTRTYFPEGTNGILEHDVLLVCYTIELPWRNNLTNRSCIPEGTYKVRKRYSTAHHWHLELVAVPQRRLILMHPANCARRELRGCIAPVTALSGVGMGTHSRSAFAKLQTLVSSALEKQEPVFILITTKK